jgi:two-component system response regulator AtoC
MATQIKVLGMTALPLILVVDHEPSDLSQICSLLEESDCRVETVSSGRAAVERVRRRPVPDLVFLDMCMPGMDGLETLKQLRNLQPDLRVVMLTSVDDPRKVVRSVRLGAEDCLVKASKRPAMAALLRQCLASLHDGHNSWAAEQTEALVDGSSFVAASPAMRKLRALVGEVAGTDIPVLCIGESGTGKEVVARLLHLLSKRSRYPFLKVNCAALPGELLESELFGYEQGAFTGAVRPKPGKFELCAKGTILLDEFAEIPPQLQAKLLHVLQDGEFTRLGGRSRIQADVRVVAATNVDIREALATKRLREDLYYRLSAVVFEIPPLRERREEIPILLRHFLKKYGGQSGLPCRPVSAAVMEFAKRHDWPGNVREVENFAKRYLALGDQALTSGNGNHLMPNRNGDSVRKTNGDHVASRALKPHVIGVKQDAEAAAILKALELTNWNRKEAARILQISYKTLLGKLRLYGLESSEREDLSPSRSAIR